MAPRFCPHCGYDLDRDEIVVCDDLRHDPRGQTWWRERPVKLAPGEHIILNSLLAAKGRIVTYSALIERIDTGSRNPMNIAAIHIHRLRSKMPGIPIINVTRRGYYWAGGHLNVTESAC